MIDPACRSASSLVIPIVVTSLSWAASRLPYWSSMLMILRAPLSLNSRALTAKYCSISPWKSRCSRLRLVKTVRSQSIASDRCRAIACEETSITHASSAAATICAKQRCSSIASGVVLTVASRLPPMICSTVPISPVCLPDASSNARVRKAVVVLPLVPVMPTICSCSVGLPLSRAAIGAIAARTSSTTTSGTPSPSSRSVSKAAAPRATAEAAKSWPSRSKPETQQNSVPDSTSLSSSSIELISASPWPLRGPSNSSRNRIAPE